jgi:hypothetical protein
MPECYDDSEFAQVVTSDDPLRCLICTGIMRDAVQVELLRGKIPREGRKEGEERKEGKEGRKMRGVCNCK